MKAFLNQLFDYNFDCNKRLIEAFGKTATVSEKSGMLFSHILNAHHIWNNRILGKPVDYEVFQIHAYKAWADIHYENQRTTFEIITGADDFDKRIDYETTQGRLFTNSLKDILVHIVNHSTHHRGQISVDFRNNGQEPLPMDYIHYKR